ncbi:MAG TPA: CPBP family intramembrane metalloprotease, partial [Candidatus Paenibacillus intestinavium]|nr:CPBP family intramembrane metalloprotease [Candidatus Paenibacillus intestinavium]
MDIFEQLSTNHDAKVSNEAQADPIYIVMLVTGFLAPFVEEIIFRGLLYQTLKTHYAMSRTIIIQASIFAVIHINPLQIIYTFALGLLFAWLVVSVNSLWGSILM